MLRRKTKVIFIGVPVLLALLLAVLRGNELCNGFEYSTGLAVASDPSVVLMRIATVGALAVLAVLSAFSRPSCAGYEERFCGTLGGSIMAAGGVLLALAAAMDYFGGENVVASRVVLILFAVFAGAACILAVMRYRNRENSKLHGVFAAVPVFMFCFMLVLLYRDIASEPSVETYAYEVLGVAALILAMYRTAALAVEPPARSPRMAFFLAAAAFVLLSAEAGGAMTASALDGISARDTGMLGYYAAGIVWVFGAMLSICSEAEGGSVRAPGARLQTKK